MIVTCEYNMLIKSNHLRILILEHLLLSYLCCCLFTVELLSSMLNIGLGVGFLPGMFYDMFGPQWASALGLVVSVSAYMLIWSSTRYVSFYSNNSWLMAIYFFICGKFLCFKTCKFDLHAKAQP